jgi:hypothetical protein
MSRTQAAELARIKVRFAARWRIDYRSVEAASGPGFSRYVATERATGRVLTDASVAGLEVKLQCEEAGL